MASKDTKVESIFADYQQKVASHVGYFAMSRTRVAAQEKGGTKKYFLQSTSLIAQFIYWFFYINTFFKAIFLGFLITGHFGPIPFLDKIAALDYILCVGIVTFGSRIWFQRYPLYEILHSFWKVQNGIFQSLGAPKDLKEVVERRQRATVWIHLGIVWFGCTFLVTQFYADPKYCVWTYSAFGLDTWYLRLIFVGHEFFFMMHPWNNMTGSSSLCTFQGIAFSTIIDRMTETLSGLHVQEQQSTVKAKGKLPCTTTGRVNLAEDGATCYRKVGDVIFDYKKLMLISEQFNSWVSYKIVFLHACGYCQFISDVFVAMQVLKLPGAGLWDVWFYIEDSLASMYVIYHVYTLMSKVEPASRGFLKSVDLYLTTNTREKRLLRKVTRTLKVVSLKIGPCPVTPMTVLKAVEMLGNYYICVALWK